MVADDLVADLMIVTHTKTKTMYLGCVLMQGLAQLLQMICPLMTLVFNITFAKKKKKDSTLSTVSHIILFKLFCSSFVQLPLHVC